MDSNNPECVTFIGRRVIYLQTCPVNYLIYV